MSAVPDLPELPPIDTARGGDADMVCEELAYFIGRAIVMHPRSQQTRLGPSEIGSPCARRLGYRLAGVAEVNDRGPAWKPTVGTAVHAWLEETFRGVNRDLGVPRFLLEHKVDTGEAGGEHITGSCDLYDRVTATVVDWKIVGTAALRRYKKDGPGTQYRTQAHLYGRGWQRRGQPVDTVGIFFLPQNGELSEAHFWHEPYDEQIAVDALTRLDAIYSVVDKAGLAALPLLPTGDAYCNFCPFYMPAATELTEACPGHVGTTAHMPPQTSATTAANTTNAA